MAESPNIYTSIWVSVYSAYIVAQCAEEWRRTGNAGAIVGNEDRFAEEAATVAELAVEAERRRRASLFGAMTKAITAEELDPAVAGIVSREGQRAIRDGLEAMLDESQALAPGGRIITSDEAHTAIARASPRTPPTGRAAIIAQGDGPWRD